MPVYEKVTAQQVSDALTKSHGLVSVAARSLGVSRATIYKYIKKYPTIKQAHDDAADAMTDTAESALFEKILAGDLQAIIFYLRTMGKGRGYTERQEIVGADGKEIVLRVVHGDK